jgi:hypothetical protein
MKVLNMSVTYKHRLIYLIAFTVIIKLFVAGLIELGNDEVYYYTYAIQPDWNHFDHPPMVGLMIRFTTLNLMWLSGISMRLGAIAGCAISTLFIFQIGKIVSSEKTGWFAALIYNCSVYTGIISGLFILPDSPQMIFWTGSLYVMSRIIFNEENKKTWLWLLLGLLIGLASLSKVHGLYLWVGFGLYILIKKPKWLLNWRIYAAVMITLFAIFPIYYWNVQNDFITYRFHSERVTHHSIQLDSLITEIVGEFAYQNPVIYILIVVAIIYLIKNKNVFNANTLVWLLCMSVPMILIFWGVAMFNPTLPHWSGPAFIPLFIIAAHYCELKTFKKNFPHFIKIAGYLVLFILIAGTLFIRLAPFNTGSQKEENFGEYCPTLDLSGWNDFGKSFATLSNDDIASGKMKAGSSILINKWFPGGHLEFYVAEKTALPIIAVGKLEDVHKFAWLNKERKKLNLGDDAYCIVPSNLPMNVNEVYGKYFTTIENPLVINQIRSKAIVRKFYVYRLKNCKEIPQPIIL